MYYFCTVHYLLNAGTIGPGDLVWSDDAHNLWTNHTMDIWIGSMYRHDMERFLTPLPIKNEAIVNKLRALYT